VDFAKTGVPAVFPSRDLRAPDKYPSFMDNSFKEKYTSTKILGKIYERTKKKDFWGVDLSGDALVSDVHIRQFCIKHPLPDERINDAFNLMEDYNSKLWDLMRLYGVNNEFEALSGFVRKFSRKVDPGSRESSDVQNRLNKEIKGLKETFESIFWETVSSMSVDDDGEGEHKTSYAKPAIDGTEGESISGGTRVASYNRDRKSLVAMQLASVWYTVTYMRVDAKEKKVIPLISFPWIVYDVLCEVKLFMKK
jgi:hypothetical protein